MSFFISNANDFGEDNNSKCTNAETPNYETNLLNSNTFDLIINIYIIFNFNPNFMPCEY